MLETGKTILATWEALFCLSLLVYLQRNPLLPLRLWRLLKWHLYKGLVRIHQSAFAAQLGQLLTVIVKSFFGVLFGFPH